MKCSTASWTVTLAAAALLALPVAAASQQNPPAQPPATAQPAASAEAPQAAQGTPQEHLRQARAALDDVGTATLGARARTQVAELKKRLATLEKTASAAAPAGAKAPSWGTEVAAMDKILTLLLGPEATGTTGSTNKAAAATTLDDATRAKLTAFRTHLTGFATAMAAPSAATSETPAATNPPAQPTPPTQPPATPPSTPPATPPTEPAQTPQQPAAQVDQEAARRHLTEARNTLSQLTQLPAAAQLAGDARTQVAQLISNFNELITTQSNWRAAYSKVDANLTALVGPEGAAAPTGTPGAVGTSGAGMTLDPAIRAKLLELRKNLSDFERASGGGAAAPKAAEPTAPAEPAKTDPPKTEPAKPEPTKPEPTKPEPTASPTSTSTVTDQTPAAGGSALQHLTAIEVILKTANESGGITLDKAQLELLRTHLAELRKALEKK